MAEGTTTPNLEGTTQQTSSADPSGSGEQFTPITSQEEFDKRIKARIERVKSTPPADYEELKAKAAKYDELEEAQKSELERANDAATKAQAEAADWKSRFEQAEAEREHARQVAEMATQYGVDAGTLTRMAGDVEDNAKYLAGIEAARPKFGDMRDGGEPAPAPQTLADALKGARSQKDRIRIRAEFNARNRKAG